MILSKPTCALMSLAAALVLHCGMYKESSIIEYKKQLAYSFVQMLPLSPLMAQPTRRIMHDQSVAQALLTSSSHEERRRTR